MSERVSLYKSKVTANWDKMDRVTGRVVEKGQETIEGKVRPFLTVETERGDVRVYHTEGLSDLLTIAVPGTFVDIEHLGMVQTRKGNNFRQFRAEAWTEPGAPPVKERKSTGRVTGARAAKGK